MSENPENIGNDEYPMVRIAWLSVDLDTPAWNQAHYPHLWALHNVNPDDGFGNTHFTTEHIAYHFLSETGY